MSKLNINSDQLFNNKSVSVTRAFQEKKLNLYVNLYSVYATSILNFIRVRSTVFALLSNKRRNIQTLVFIIILVFVGYIFVVQEIEFKKIFKILLHITYIIRLHIFISKSDKISLMQIPSAIKHYR